MYHISARRNGQFWDPWASFLCSGTFPDSFMRPAVPHSWPARGSATRKPGAKGKIKPVRQETFSAGALPNGSITLQLSGTHRALYLPVITLLAHHITPLLTTFASPAHCGVPQCFHHRPPGIVKHWRKYDSSVQDFTFLKTFYDVDIAATVCQIDTRSLP